MADKEEIGGLIEYLKSLPPERFDQTQWCGTAYCLAGHQVERHGWKQSGPWYPALVEKDGKDQRVSQIAKETLGLTWKEAATLFDKRGAGWIYQKEFAAAQSQADKLAVAIKELETYLL
jgi:hypothetical protein